MELNSDGNLKDEEDPTQVIVSEAASSSSSVSSPLNEELMRQMSLRKSDKVESESHPNDSRLGDCTQYIWTGCCKFGTSCKFNHIPDRELEMERILTRKRQCQSYLKTGICTFGSTCKFDHPTLNAGITTGYQFNSIGYPLRLNSKDCPYYVRTGKCKFGNTCKFNHPAPSSSMPFLSPATPSQQSYPVGPTSFSAIPQWQDPSSYGQLIIPQGLVQAPSWNAFPERIESTSSSQRQQQQSWNSQFAGMPHQGRAMDSCDYFSSFQVGSSPTRNSFLHGGSILPQRPGELECPFYLRTGDCKFGAICRFHHSIKCIPNCKLNPAGLPLRPEKPICPFYSRFGICKFAVNCKYDHPICTPKDTSKDSLPTSSSSDAIIVQPVSRSSSDDINDSLPTSSSSDAIIVQPVSRSSSDDINAHPISESSSDVIIVQPVLSSSSDAIIVQPVSGSSSGPPSIPSTFESSPVADPSKLTHLPSNSQQMNSDEEKVESK